MIIPKTTTLFYPPQDLDLNNSYAASAESAPEETWIQKQKKGGKKAESKLSAVQQPEVENPNITEEPEVRKKEKAETSNEVGILKTYSYRSRLKSVAPNLLNVLTLNLETGWRPLAT